MDLDVEYKVESDTCQASDVAKDMTEAMNKASAEGWAVHDTALALEQNTTHSPKVWYHWIITYVRDANEAELLQLGKRS